MEIRPSVVTLSTALIAATAVAVVVLTTDPATATAALFVVLWAALSIGIWSGYTTVLLWCRISMAKSVWIGLGLAAISVAAIAFRHILR